MAGGPAAGRTVRGQCVVVGHGPRPASPDIVTGVATALRRNGCQVVDVGLTTTPCFWFAVQHLEAAAGLYVTGSRCDPSSIGLDVLGRRGVPWSQGEVPAGPTGPVPAGLTVLEERWKAGFSRPLRSAGPQRSFDAWHPYQASLWKHFHALRPLDIAVGCPARQVRELLQRLMEKLPCRLHLVDLPVRRRNLTDQDDADIQRIGRAVRTGKRHLGIVIDDDAQGCAFVDERGTLIAASTVSLLAIDVLLREQPQASVAVQSRVLDRLQPMIAARHGDCFDAGTTAQQMAVAMRTCDAVCGGGENGRLWFRETAPTCDAVLTLARILQALSLSDAPFSQVAANHGV